MRQRSIKWEAFCAAFVLLFSVYLGFLALITTYSADDFAYSTFWDGTLADYITRMREHYLTMNGRVVVHIAAHGILHCGNGVFAAVLTGLCLATPVLAWACCRETEGSVLTCVLIFLTGVITLSRRIMVEGMLWISAFCNYMLPTFMIVLLLFLLNRMLSRRRKAFLTLIWTLLCGVWAFLCGATTEQSGFITLCVLVLACLCCCKKGLRQKLPAGLFALIAAGLGWGSIFLSPATRTRMTGEPNFSSGPGAGLAEILVTGLRTQAECLHQFLPLRLLILAVLLLTVWTMHRQKSRIGRGIAAGAAALGTLALICPDVSIPLHIPAYVLAMLCLFTAALCCWRAGQRTQGVMILCALASVAVMLPTVSTAGRTLLPCSVYLIAAVATLLTPLLNTGFQRLLLPILVILAVCTGAGELPHYWHNHLIEQKNQEYVRQAQTDGALRYCADYDTDFTHTKPYSDSVLLLDYFQAAHLDPEQIPFQMYSDTPAAAFVDQAPLESFLFPEHLRKGNYMLPLRGVIETAGGAVDYQGEIRVSLNGRAFALQPQTWGHKRIFLIRWTDADGTLQAAECQSALYDDGVCLPEWVFTEVFGFTVTHQIDSAGNTNLWLVSPE